MKFNARTVARHLAGVGLAATCCSVVPRAADAQLTQTNAVFGGGGGDAAGGTYVLRHTIGQRVVGPSIGGALEHMHGFWNATSIPVPLPVELVELTAVVENRDAILSWSTLSESGNVGFAVEWRLGGGVADSTDDSWTEVVFIPGAGTSSATRQYRYRATSMELGAHRFRLKQIDVGGAVAYSDEIEVLVELQTPYLLGDVFPNPFGPEAQLAVAVREEQRVTIAAYDILGRFVYTLFDGQLTANQNHRIHIDGSRLASGPVLLRIKGDNFVETRTILRIR